MYSNPTFHRSAAPAALQPKWQHDRFEGAQKVEGRFSMERKRGALKSNEAAYGVKRMRVGEPVWRREQSSSRPYQQVQYSSHPVQPRQRQAFSSPQTTEVGRRRDGGRPPAPRTTYLPPKPSFLPSRPPSEVCLAHPPKPPGPPPLRAFTAARSLATSSHPQYSTGGREARSEDKGGSWWTGPSQEPVALRFLPKDGQSLSQGLQPAFSTSYGHRPPPQLARSYPPSTATFSYAAPNCSLPHLPSQRSYYYSARAVPSPPAYTPRKRFYPLRQARLIPASPPLQYTPPSNAAPSSKPFHLSRQSYERPPPPPTTKPAPAPVRLSSPPSPVSFSFHPSAALPSSPSATSPDGQRYLTPPTKLQDGEPNPPWLEEALFGPVFANWEKKQNSKGVQRENGRGKKRRRGGEEEDGEEGEVLEEDVVGDGVDWVMWEERKGRREGGKDEDG